MLTYGSLGFGILAVVAPLVLYRARRAEVPIFLSMASLACVAAVMGTSALGGDDSMFYDTAPAFMYCSITLLVLVLAINAWLLWRAFRKHA
ncbi:hypothetical protein [Collinsella sp.]|jgi:ABC-type nickel/cobalt efflux system permease component RcnA|uniref:hypothetical protein n=1 Tax=Collinsella sp. TaxID=1965294 RepID=UPI0025F277EA|nr:hypothetical protein [uncultured Collinsella sp.]